MSLDEGQDTLPESSDQTDTGTVAVGLVATAGQSEALARAILRAQSLEYEVFVARASEQATEAVHFAEALGADVVLLRDTDPDLRAVQQGLAIAAEQAGYSNLLVNTDVTERIDYARSKHALAADEFCVEAPTETEPTHTDVSPGVLAAIPAYNEAESIAPVVEDCQAGADEILVVDDGSDDNTAARASEAGATVIEHETNQGYGAALQTAFSEAADRGADHLVVLDGDGQHDPADIPRLIDAQQEHDGEVVIGSRFAGDGTTDAPLYRRFGLWIVNVLTNISLGVVRSRSRVQDTQSGFRAYDSTAIESLATSADIGEQMSASTDILYHAHDNDFEIKEVGTTITYDVESASSHSPVEHGLTLVKNILYTIERQRPITVLGVPGFLSQFVGLGFAYWTVSNYIATGTFPLGLAIVSVFFVLTGVFASFTGLILHSLNHHLNQ